MTTTRDYKSEFIKLIKSYQYSKQLGDMFRDFLEMSWCSLYKGSLETIGEGDTPEALEIEQQYMSVVSRYRTDTDKKLIRECYPKLLGLVVCYYEDGINGDLLGDVAGELNALNANLGQFFTPWPVCKLMAGITVGDKLLKIIEDKGYATVQEPACGSGANILAFASCMSDQDISPRLMIFDAIDISPTAMYMCWIQCALGDLMGIVHLGSALSDLKDLRSYPTPRYMVNRYNLLKRDPPKRYTRERLN